MWCLQVLHCELLTRTSDRLEIVLLVNPSTLQCDGVEDLEPTLLIMISCNSVPTE